MKKIEVCFSPALFEHRILRDNLNIVVVDILRATTSFCAAFQHGVESIIPVSCIEKVKEYKANNYPVACERDGKILDFADYGNSAFDFMQEGIIGKSIAYSTTNGTHAIEIARNSGKVIAGSFLNISALSDWLSLQSKDVLILCAGWKNKFSLEDALFAGALCERLLGMEGFGTQCDSSEAALDLWKTGKTDPLAYVEKAMHRHRLKRLGVDDVLEYTFQMDSCPVVPVLQGGKLINVIG